MFANIKYWTFFSAAYLFSLLPLRILYVFSDISFVIVYYLTRYRKRVVRKNLRNSFPDKSERELLKIEREFFRWFCDYVFETIKLISIGKKEMARRMRFEGIDESLKFVDKKIPVTVYLGHYCNWEWVTSFAMHTPGRFCANLYHELESKTADRLFLYLRTRFGAHAVKMEDTLATLSKWHKDGNATLVGFVSDQVPGFSSMHYWPMFLNQLTPTYSGAERIAKLFNCAVFYMDIRRPKRGYYVARLIKMSDDAKKEPKFALTEMYYRLLERSIIDNPPYWLWSHNRWKRTWEDFCKVYPDENERKRIMSKL